VYLIGSWAELKDPEVPITPVGIVLEVSKQGVDCAIVERVNASSLTIVMTAQHEEEVAMVFEGIVGPLPRGIPAAGEVEEVVGDDDGPSVRIGG